MSKVRAALGVTKNLGNFESMRFDYSYETDMLEGETPEEALDRANGIVYAYLEKKIKEEEF
jgi:hypothetical protein